MIKKVKNISRSMFRRINFYPTSEPITKDTHAYISIYGTGLDELPAPKINHNLWMCGIQLMFDDIDNNSKNLKTISDHQALRLVNFIRHIHQSPNNITLIIHCYAGLSRSAGVGMFVNNVLHLNLPNYNKLEFYNKIVHRKLMNAWNQKNDFISEKFQNSKTM